MSADALPPDDPEDLAEPPAGGDVLRLPTGGPLAVRRGVDPGFLQTVPTGRGAESVVQVALARADTVMSAPERVAVCLDGQVVGLLSVHVSSAYLPVLRLAEERGLTLEARAVVRRGMSGGEIEVWAPRAPGLDAEWLATLHAAPAVGRSEPAASATVVADTGPAEEAGPGAAAGPAAGWYPDPLGAPTSRYWDGVVWTDHVRSRP